ncbi:MAG TPA: hypothetical protein DDZ96_12765 [Porphyromonadaceae bacterium]|jgi:hypothetical protein|uniref:hypothetical protein n=1 Tax=Limibacterium fermenti TaxID=3229863 RepID=UPI000E84080B|nr:hypothetical protein [Porphyromonadaceae bacterium]HBK30225.1 hypothetical protein [Porphyromonadaceae bacterium]HBL34667.1 hypothetical protein [Porphyromonadaceae bacterium]HBX21478.1 hypothetical protein [Porphyromonadaceae bacterium]HBX44692.1 hypothetical protein [Porphyromonadaceae bacterium]
MKVFYTKHLPVKGFKAINLFGFVFARREFYPIKKDVLRHEAIHTRQILETLIIGFYVWYIIEWLIRWMQYKNPSLAYRNICFEREAYAYDQSMDYLQRRPLWNFIKFLKKEQGSNL